MTIALSAPLEQGADGIDSLGRLGGQRFCTDQQPSAQRVEWLKEVIGREYANVEITPPKDMVLFMICGLSLARRCTVVTHSI